MTSLPSRLRDWWRDAVRLLATVASSEVGVELAVGQMTLPFARQGWKMAPPPHDPSKCPRCSREAT